jgi:hypothetical protein
MYLTNNYLTQADYFFIDEFIERCIKASSIFAFHPPRVSSSGLPHKYDLPYIGISEEETVLDNNWYDGYLGSYFRGDTNSIKREGKIVLYRKNIEKAAYRLSLDEKLDFSLSYSLIFKIVLAHELSHWMFHYCQIKIDDKDYDSEDGINILYANIERNLHEYIAQKMTREVFKIHTLFELTFNWLLKNQEEPYTTNIPEDISKIAAFKYFLLTKGDKIETIRFIVNNNKEIDYDSFKVVLKDKRGFVTGKKCGL